MLPLRGINNNAPVDQRLKQALSYLRRFKYRRIEGSPHTRLQLLRLVSLRSFKILERDRGVADLHQVFITRYIVRVSADSNQRKRRENQNQQHKLHQTLMRTNKIKHSSNL